MFGNGFFKWPKSYIVFVVCASQNSLSEKPEKNLNNFTPIVTPHS